MTMPVGGWRVRKWERLLVMGVVLYLAVGLSSMVVGKVFNSHAGVAFLLGSVLFGSISPRNGPRWFAGSVVRLVKWRTSPGTAIELRAGLTLASGVIVLGLCYLIPCMVHRFEPEVTTVHGQQ